MQRSLTASAALLAVALVVHADADKKAPTRSVYVPIIFAIAPELGVVRLTIVGEDVSFSPQPRTFLFTYYPEHDKILPKLVEIRVDLEKPCSNGEETLSFIVEPFIIQSGDDSFETSKKELSKLSRSGSRDVRLSPRIVTLRCPDTETERETEPRIELGSQ